MGEEELDLESGAETDGGDGNRAIQAEDQDGMG